MNDRLLPGLELGNRLRAVREAMGLTQELFAQRIGFNYTAQPEISKWEKGLAAPSPDRMERIRALAKEAGVLFLLDDPSGSSMAIVSEPPSQYGHNAGARAHGWIGRVEHTAALRRGEGELHYGDIALDGIAEAKERGWTVDEILTAFEWLAAKLRESERARLALQRSARSRPGERGEEGGTDVRDR